MMNQSSVYKTLDELQVWQRAVDFAAHVCREILPGMPVEEKDALAVQLRRSVQRVPASIASSMGAGRDEGLHYGYQARGYLEESRSHLVLARRLEYLSDELFQQFATEISALLSLLNSYISELLSREIHPAAPVDRLPSAVEGCRAEAFTLQAASLSELDTHFYLSELRLPDLGI